MHNSLITSLLPLSVLLRLFNFIVSGDSFIVSGDTVMCYCSSLPSSAYSDITLKLARIGISTQWKSANVFYLLIYLLGSVGVFGLFCFLEC